MADHGKPRSLATALAAALRREEFLLYCQEIRAVSADTRTPFQEILVRFRDEEEKLLPPGSFFPLLEENGLMPLLDRWVLGKVQRWIDARRAASPDFVVPHNSMNVSTQTLADRHFPGFAQKCIGRARLPPEAFTFELSGSAVETSAGEARGFSASMARIGCTLVICNVDGSQGSMDAVRALKPHFVKLSPALLKNLRAGSREYDALYQLNARCKALGMKTIAERVERNRVVEMLKTVGVDYVQGFAVALPRPLE